MGIDHPHLRHVRHSSAALSDRRADRPSGEPMNRNGFDEVIHAPNRLQICAYLASLSEIEFVTLRDFIGVSDSVLSKHLKLLADAGYLDVIKRAENGRQRTWIALTRDGRKAYQNHVRELKRIVG
jgi:DNA-binding MarR family transcriptional regulator